MKFNLEDLNDLLTEGKWEWKVIEAAEATDKNGKRGFKLVCNVTDVNGKTTDAKTWLPLWRLEEFCRSGGLDAEFEKREVTSQDCLRASGVCLGKTEIGGLGDKGKFPDKSVIVTFLPPETKSNSINNDLNF